MMTEDDLKETGEDCEDGEIEGKIDALNIWGLQKRNWESVSRGEVSGDSVSILRVVKEVGDTGVELGADPDDLD